MLKKNKLNNLQSILPEGAVVSGAWLKAEGYSRTLIDWYLNSGWLLSFGRGAYHRPVRKPEWQDLVASIQKLGYPVHLGGRTALSIHGYEHNLSTSKKRTLYLYSYKKTLLPKWLKGNNGNYLFKHVLLTSFHESLDKATLLEIDSPKLPWRMKIACPERAFLEFLHAIPQSETLDTAKFYMEGLQRLRPDLLNQLLSACSNIKVNRLFLYLADELKLPWFSKLNIRKIELGSGNRSIVKGGKLNKKYLITV